MKVLAVLLTAFSFVLAQTDSSQVQKDSLSVTDSLSQITIDISQVSKDIVSDSTVLESADSTLVLDTLNQIIDNVKNETLPKINEGLLAKQELLKPQKTVLYLSGGERSPWFHLGVLYAIEAYSIQVDSIVGTSWGAFIGFLWAKGMPLDEIQKALLDPYISKYVGHNMFGDYASASKYKHELPISDGEIPSLKYRFKINTDTSGKKSYQDVRLQIDSLEAEYALAKLRFQELLYRQSKGFVIPFVTQDCNGEELRFEKNVLKSLPLKENVLSGELCSFLPLPKVTNPKHYSIVSNAIPSVAFKENNFWKTPWQKVLAENSARKLRDYNYENLVQIQAYAINDTSRSAWIQAGFSATEKHLAEFSSMRNSPLDYVKSKKKTVPWFKLHPSYDSLSAELHSVVKSYWDESDTGLVAAENFVKEVSKNPVYDSIRFDMQPNGDLLIDVNALPTVDVYAGGFGSNAIGPNAYAGISLSYVTQIEILLSVWGFWGIDSYGINPRVEFSHVWKKNWSFWTQFQLQKITPMTSFRKENSNFPLLLSESKKDLFIGIDYQLDKMQKFSLNFMLGNRSLDFSPWYLEKTIETAPIFPSFRYQLLTGENDRFFALNGVSFFAEMGMQSVRYKVEIPDLIPIYYKFYGEARFTHSPRENFTFSIATNGGLDSYHKEGYGYVFPERTGYIAIDNCYRQRINVTPWSSEWYNPELLSHSFVALRLNGGLHYKGSGLWLFGAFVHDFENNSSAQLNENKFILEPALRLSYKSISIYAGMSRIVDEETFDNLAELKDYNFFIRVGNYDLF